MIAELFAFTIIATVVSASETGIIVHTPQGPIRGVEYVNTSGLHDYAAFRNIPFGKDTGGAARWTAPVSVAPWSEPIDATQWGPSCPSSNHTLTPFSEDCLNLNVWAPSSALTSFASSDLLPVMVWIHGGGFFEGSAVDWRWDGSIISGQSETIVVSMNYRLGALGFLRTEDLEGNYGIMDQQLALQWVQDNIQSFGGDPKRVTLWGQSAGAMAVVVHMASPKSEGLFSQAIAMSPVGQHYKDLGEELGPADTLASALHCSSRRDLDCLRKQSFSDILKAQLLPEYIWHIKTDGFVNFLPWIPSVGTDILPDHPIRLFEQGKFNRVPLVISTTRNETDAFLPPFLNNSLEYWLMVEFAEGIHGKGKAVRKFYDSFPGTKDLPPYSKLGIFSTDQMMTCYSRNVTRILAQKQNPVALSTFLHAPSRYADPRNAHLNYRCEDGSSCHACDIPFAFNSCSLAAADNFTCAFTDEENAIALQLSKAYISFAHYGFTPPSSSSLKRKDQVEYFSWQVYDQSQDATIGWGAPPYQGTAENDDENDDDAPQHHVINGYHKTQCDFWDSLGPYT